MQDMLRMISFGENLGSGFPKIIDAWKDVKWDSPVLEDRLSLNEVRLTLPVPFYETSSEDTTDRTQVPPKYHPSATQVEFFTETLQKLYRNLTETDRKIVELIVSDKFITTTKMAEQIGKSRQTIATRIKDLQEKGIVRRNGPDNGGYWELIK